MSRPKTLAEATVDSVGGAIGLLWDFLSAPPRAPIAEPEPEPENAPSLLEFLPRSTPPAPEGRIPAQVIDTQGESEDD